jgi:hypothetical protein
MNANRVTELNNQSVNLTDNELSFVDKFSVTLPLNELPEIIIVSEKSKPGAVSRKTEPSRPTVIPFHSSAAAKSDSDALSINHSEKLPEAAGNPSTKESTLEPHLNLAELPVDEIDIQSGENDLKNPTGNPTLDDANPVTPSSPVATTPSVVTTTTGAEEDHLPTLISDQENLEVNLASEYQAIESKSPESVFRIEEFNQFGSRFEQITIRVEQELENRAANALVFTAPEPLPQQSLLLHNIISVLANRNPTMRVISIQATTGESKNEDFPLGIGHVLAQENELDEVVLPTTIDNLDYLAFSDSHAISGATTGLGSTFKSRATRIISELKKHYDLIAINAYPAKHAETAVWAVLADATYLLMNKDQTDEESAFSSTVQLRKNGARLVGCILTEEE